MATRRGQRPGGAALQLDVLALGSVVDKQFSDGRLKGAVDSMMSNALRPDAEVAASIPPSTSEPRIIEQSRIRLALAKGLDPADVVEGEKDNGAPLSPTPVAPTATSEPGDKPEIPFILGAGRCEIGSSGFKLLASVLTHKSFGRLVYADLSSNVATDLGKDFSGVVEICAALGPLPHLKFLSLHNNMLLQPGAEAVSKMLRTTKSLQYLDLSRCNISAAGAEELLPAFRRRRAGAPIAAGESTASAAGDDDDGVPVRPPTPENPGANQSLLWLDLSENNLCMFGFGTTDAMCDLVKGLLRHPKLRRLDLSRNRLARPVIAALAAEIEHNATIRTLRVDENDIDARPAAAIAQSLVHNSTLKTLTLRANRLRSDGASAFADLCRRGTSLTSIDLRDNYIGDVGQKDIKLALQGLPPPPEVTAYADPNSVSSSAFDGSGSGGVGDGTPYDGSGSADDDDGVGGDDREPRPATAGTEEDVARSLASDLADSSISVDEAASVATGSGSASGGAGRPTGSGGQDPTRPSTAASSAVSASGRSTPASQQLVHGAGAATISMAGDAGNAYSLDFYTEAKEGDDEDDDDEDEQGNSRRRPGIQGASGGAAAASSSESPVSPTRTPAAGGGIRAVMALRPDAPPAPIDAASIAPVAPAASAPRLLEREDGAWVDTLHGRTVYVLTPGAESQRYSQ